jgi:hypothetical protein
VTTLGENAFSKCETITEIIIPGTIDTIQKETFAGCIALKKVVIEKGVKKIDSETFNGCTSLEEIVLPIGVGKIDNSNGWGTPVDGGIFCDCPNIKAIYVPAKKGDYYRDRLDSKFHDIIIEVEPEKKTKKK